MGKPTGFMEYMRVSVPKQDIAKRIKHYNEFVLPLTNNVLVEQSGRCMNCGIPFCQNACPLGNFIPDFNDAVYKQDWQKALDILLSTNNFPEFTGRICPAPCESACVLDINKEPVIIEEIEKSIVEYAYKHNLIKPIKVLKRTGKKVAIIGSGPSGLAAASQLNKYGHEVIVFERSDKIGGLLRYGVPDFKLEKHIIDRRLELMKKEGIVFKINSNIGQNIKSEELLNNFDAVVVASGATSANKLLLDFPSDTNGICYAMDYLTQQNQLIADGKVGLNNHAGSAYHNTSLRATNCHVVIIGGGDTGADCIGTANRQGACSITQIDHAPKPPLNRCDTTPWPSWPRKLRTSSSHEEGANRLFATKVKELVIENKNITGVKIVDIKFIRNDTEQVTALYQEIPETQRIIKCDLLIIAIGFQVSKDATLFHELRLEFDAQGKIVCNNFQSINKSKVFVTGDARIGASLIVKAIADGRECAEVINKYLTV